MQPIEVAKLLKWQDSSKFQVEIYPQGSAAGSVINLDPDILTAAITNISMAEFNATPIEEYIGEQWKFSTGRLEHYQVQISLKDFNNFTLYRMFSKAIQRLSRMYPEDQYFTIIVSTADDYDITNFKKTVEFVNCMLITVSAPVLDNSANSSIAEFSVTFKAAKAKTDF